MADERRTILVCSCEDTMSLDAGALRKGCRGDTLATAHQLCRAELDQFHTAIAGGGTVVVACTQEAPLFADVAAEKKSETTLRFVNLRETAGWSTDTAAAGPKMAALLAAAAEPVPDFPLVSLTSEGVTLIYGRDEQAIEAARLLQDHLDVTVLIKEPRELAPPRVTSFPIVKGTIRAATGHFGAFEITVDDYAMPSPSS